MTRRSISGSRSPVGEGLSRKSPHSCGQVQSENECMTVDLLFYSPTLTYDHERRVDHRYNQGTLVILRAYLHSDLEATSTDRSSAIQSRWLKNVIRMLSGPTKEEGRSGHFCLDSCPHNMETDVKISMTQH